MKNIKIINQSSSQARELVRITYTVQNSDKTYLMVNRLTKHTGLGRVIKSHYRYTGETKYTTRRSAKLYGYKGWTKTKDGYAGKR